MRSIIRWCLLGCLLFASADARISAESIDSLIANADAIVIARVDELLPTSSDKGDLIYASASVQRTLKGKLAGSFMFYASGGWVCDSSTAIKGETALFFLGHADNGMYFIQMAGRGHMPTRELNGKTYVTLWDDVILPKDAPMIAGPDPRYDFIKSVELDYLQGLIRQHRRTAK
jgi:hypothetical protein